MWIEKVQLKNFGKFQEKEIVFSPGLNVVYGGNESGKTTIHSFLLGMLFGMEKARGRSREDAYATYEPWNSASYYTGSMVMQVAGKPFYLERNFYHKEKTAILQNLEDKEELSVEFGDLDMLLGGITRENYQNTYCVRQAGFMADATLADALESYMADVSNSGGGSVRIAAALEELQKKKKEAEKEKKQLQALREEKSQRISLEAELLKKDIAFLKNSELAELFQQEKEAEKMQMVQQEERKKGKKHLVYSSCALFAGLGLFAGGSILEFGILQIAGLLCIMAGIAGMFFWKNAAKQLTEEMVAEDASIHALKESLARIKEQWEEKENRCYNLEEQLYELSVPTERERELEEDVKALELAMETIEKIAGQIYEEISDKLHEAVSENLSKITHGKYDSIILDDKLHLFIWEEGRKIPVSRLSRGTLEQAYLAMRLAVGSILMKEEPMPVLLDEIFGMYDDKRLSDTLLWLSKYPGQIIVFSCQKRELEILEKNDIFYHRIELN